MPKFGKETPIQQRILLAIGGGEGVRVWRNNRGAMKNQQGQLVRFGGPPGASDVLGIRRVEITPDMVGRTIGQFVAIEVKRPGVKPTDDQDRFLAMIEGMGGLGVVATSPQEAVEAINAALGEGSCSKG